MSLNKLNNLSESKTEDLNRIMQAMPINWRYRFGAQASCAHVV